MHNAAHAEIIRLRALVPEAWDEAWDLGFKASFRAAGSHWNASDAKRRLEQ